MILQKNFIALLMLMLGLFTVANQTAFSNLEFPLIGASGEKIFGAGHAERVLFNSDGHLISGGTLGALIWDVQTGELLDWIARYPGHTQPVLDIAASADGNLLLTGSRDRSARVWNISTGQQVTALEQLLGEVVAVGLSPNAEKFFTASAGTIQVWKSSDASLLHSIPLGISIRWARFSPKGDLAVSVATIAKDPLGGYFGDASDPQAAFLVNLKTGEIVQTPILPEQEYVANADFSPDGSLVAITDQKGLVKIWNVYTGIKVAELTDNASFGLNLRFSPEGNRIATAVSRQPVKIWDIGSQTVLQTLPQNETVLDLAFSPDGKRLAICGHNKIQIWDIVTEQEIVSLDAFAQSGSGLISPDGSRIVLRNNGITVWNVESSQIIIRDKQLQSELLAGISSDSKQLLTYSNQDWSVWNLDTLQLIRKARVSASALGGSFSTLQFSPDNSRIVSVFSDEVSVWQTSSGEKIRDFVLSDGYSSNQAMFKTNSEIIVFASKFDGVTQETVWLGDIETGAITLKSKIIPQPNVHYANLIAFSPDFDVFIRSASHPADFSLPMKEFRTLPIFNSLTGNQTQVLVEHSNAILVSAFSPNGSEIAEGGIDQLIHIWDWKKPSEKEVMKGHTHSVFRLQYSADSKKILSSSFDGTVRLWDSTSRSLTSILNWLAY